MWFLTFSQVIVFVYLLASKNTLDKYFENSCDQMFIYPLSLGVTCFSRVMRLFVLNNMLETVISNGFQ